MKESLEAELTSATKPAEFVQPEIRRAMAREVMRAMGRAAARKHLADTEAAPIPDAAAANPSKTKGGA